MTDEKEKYLAEFLESAVADFNTVLPPINPRRTTDRQVRALEYIAFQLGQINRKLPDQSA